MMEMGMALGVWVLTVLLFLLAGYGAAEGLRNWTRLPTRYGVPLIWVVLCLVGYGVFFAMAWNPMLGWGAAIASLAALVSGTVWTVWRRAGTMRGWRVWGVFALVPVLCGTFALANVAALDEPDGPFIRMPAMRYLAHGLPGDNVIPYVSAHYVMDQRWEEPLFEDENLAGWQISDRPPLQSGVYMLFLPISKLLGIPSSMGYLMVGTMLQLLWVPALWLLAGRFVDGVTAGRILFVLAGCGMAVINTTFVWPKLLGAGFALLAIDLVTRDGRCQVARLLLAAGMFGLGLLAHGGSLFTTPAFGLAFLWHWRRRLPLGIGLGLAVAVVLLMPWTAFQKSVAPPGNNLIKWHLAGQFEPDDRSLKEALVAGYGSVTVGEVLEKRWENLLMIVGWHEDARLSWEGREALRESVRAMLWSLVLPSAGGMLVGLIGWGVAVMRRREVPGRRREKGWVLGLWWVASFGFWLALIFDGGQVFMHHGSYASTFLFYLWLLMGARAAGTLWLGVATILQTLLFLWIWWWPSGVHGLEAGAEVRWVPLVLAAGIYGGMGVWFWMRGAGAGRLKGGVQ